MNGYLVYTAPWIIPVDGEVVRNGAIVLNSDMIVCVGSQEEILEKWGDADVVELEGVAIPPLTNCHIHLELSHLREIERPGPEQDMTSWIESVLVKRSECLGDDAAILQSIDEELANQHASGVFSLVDICNVAEYIPRIQSHISKVHSIYEMLAPNKQRTAEALKVLDQVPAEQAVSPHALYSTSAQLITTLKKRCDENNHVFSIHLAESADEIEFIQNTSGAFRRFLEKRKSWDGTIVPQGSFEGPVDYLSKLKVLDENTLCVHCVHLTDEEVAKLAESGAKVCLCPGSNRFLGVGAAPVEKMLERDILPAIGTDSAASNESLDLWEEMKILLEEHPGVNPADIFKMATLGGAAALQCEQEYGTLSAGKLPLFIEIVGGFSEVSHADELLNKIVSEGLPEKVRWIAPFLDN